MSAAKLIQCRAAERTGLGLGVALAAASGCIERCQSTWHLQMQRRHCPVTSDQIHRVKEAEK
jgi:hypothetical protein